MQNITFAAILDLPRVMSLYMRLLHVAFVSKHLKIVEVIDMILLLFMALWCGKAASLVYNHHARL